MYIPAHFREDDLTTLQAFISDYPFATLVTQLNGRLVASHIPLTFDPQQSPYGTLFGHVARGNQQWQSFDDVQEALVIFQGPHTHISASWYENSTKSVPTWNYATVHAYGIARQTNHEELLQHLIALVQQFEGDGEAARWSFEPGDAFIQRMALGIVGFTIPITRIEGKFKLSQNRSQQDQERVIEALLSLSDADAKDVASLMQTHLSKMM